MADTLADVMTADKPVKRSVVDRSLGGYLRDIYGPQYNEKVAAAKLAQTERPQVVKDARIPKLGWNSLDEKIPVTLTAGRGRPLGSDQKIAGLYHPPGQPFYGPSAYVLTPTGKEAPFFTGSPGQVPQHDLYAAPELWFGGVEGPDKTRAYMPTTTKNVMHELTHHNYQGHPFFGSPKMWGDDMPTQEQLEVIMPRYKKVWRDTGLHGAFMGRDGGLAGNPSMELPPSLADVVRWGAVRDLTGAKLAENPDYRRNAPTKKENLSLNPRDAAKTWDAFGDFLNENKTWGRHWSPEKHKAMDEANRELIINYMPELTQSDDIPSNMIA